MRGSDIASRLAASDGALAREIASTPEGEAGAAESELYRRFAPRVRLFGLKHLRDDMAADDLAQQVMLVAIERLRAGEVRNPDEIGSFILGTSRVIASGLRRRERRREELHMRFDAREAVDSGFDERMFDVVRLAPCLAAMRDRERTILLLTFYSERSAVDIAAALGMTSGAVRVGRHRAISSMRACLETRGQA
jgi:RNA polymerase sigma-70 factor (ECF subfamily)